MTHQDRVAAALDGFMQQHRHAWAPRESRRRCGSTAEGRLLRRIVEALRADPDLLVWRNTVGVGEHDGRRVTYGLALGSSDLIGLLGPHGRFVAFEVKTPEGRLTEHQARFLERVRRQGGIAAVVRSVDEARTVIAQARQENLVRA
jgi:hypothetical protein